MSCAAIYNIKDRQHQGELSRKRFFYKRKKLRIKELFLKLQHNLIQKNQKHPNLAIGTLTIYFKLTILTMPRKIHRGRFQAQGDGVEESES